jgi:hypothetical protein
MIVCGPASDPGRLRLFSPSGSLSVGIGSTAFSLSVEALEGCGTVAAARPVREPEHRPRQQDAGGHLAPRDGIKDHRNSGIPPQRHAGASAADDGVKVADASVTAWTIVLLGGDHGVDSFRSIRSPHSV